MKSITTKKVVVIFTVLIVIVLSAILVAYTVGTTKIPSLTNPDGIFYERVNDNGDVIYTISNQELFDEIKGNDGVDQALLLVDAYLLYQYLDDLTDAEIQTKITELTYGTSDAETIAAMDDATKQSYEDAYNQSMVLAGYLDNQEEYASLVLAREHYALYAIDTNGDISDLDVASQYVNSYFEDVKAIKIRFTSQKDALDVMHQFKLLTYNVTTLREYLGYIFVTESIFNGDEVADAYKTVTPYYFSTSGDIYDLTDSVIYTLGDNDIFTDAAGDKYTLDSFGNLVDIELNVVVENDLMFNSKEEATAYKTANTHYYTITKTDAFDDTESARIYDENDVLVYTMTNDGTIYDLTDTDVTDTCGLIVNKVYTPIDEVVTTTVNNSAELTDAQILAKYIEMYNYVYGEYRDALPTDATAAQLIASNDAWLVQNYDTTLATQSSLAAYIFKTLDLNTTTSKDYSTSPKAYAGSNDDNYYLVYKLTQPAKVDVYQEMVDLVAAHIQVPSEIGGDFTLPTTGWYGAKITWTSSDAYTITINSGAATVTLPAADTSVTLTYTITLSGVTKTGTKVVTVLADGVTSTLPTNYDEEVSFKTLLNDPTLYEELYDYLLQDMVYGDSGSDNIQSQLILLRQDYNLQFNDYWMALSYQQTDNDLAINDKGNKTVLFSLSGRPGQEDTAYEVTADQYFTYVMTKNPALYILYASQAKEILSSDYFVEMFGPETNLSKNNSLRMQDMYKSVSDTKSYYAYLQNLYAQYGIAFTYASLQDYTYLQYGTKTENELLLYFIQSAIQPYYIDEAINQYDLVNILYPTVQEDYENYFSLNVSQILIYIDFNEDGTPDNYNDYLATLTEQEASDFESLLASFETEIFKSGNDFADMIDEYNNASRTDETWGVYKQAGIILMTEDLNQTDADGNSMSVTYSGDYGIKDAYVPEFTAKLVSMYDLYTQEQNLDQTEMYGTVVTQFGYHIIMVTKGDDFTQPTAEFTEADPANPAYTAGSENANGEPTLEQLVLYATYFFYSTVYDLSDADLEQTYGITVPELPASVTAALDVYFSTLLQDVYVLGTVNIVMTDHLQDGNFLDSGYSDFTDAELHQMLTDVHDVYYAALFDSYTQN